MADISVGGGAAPGQSPTDNPLELSVHDGSLTRRLKGNTSGNPEISGAAASGAALAGNPVVIGAGAGTNAQTLGANTLGQLFVTAEGQLKTFSYSTLGYAVISGATDMINIKGSGTKAVRIDSIRVTGAATAAQLVTITVIKRSTANSGSTPVALTGVPHDSTLPNTDAATAVVNSYTSTNPTLGSTIGKVRTSKLFLGTIDGAVEAPAVEMIFGKENGQPIILHGTTESLSLNFNGGTVPSGMVLDISIETTEI